MFVKYDKKLLDLVPFIGSTTFSGKVKTITKYKNAKTVIIIVSKREKPKYLLI